MSNSLRPQRLQHARLLSPSLFPGVCLNSRPLSQWCYLTISSSAAPFSFCHQSFPASGSFSMSWLFASGGRSTGDSALVYQWNIDQGWFPLDLTDLISLQSKGLSKVFSSTTVQKHEFFSAFFKFQFSHPYMTTGKTTFRASRKARFPNLVWSAIHSLMQIFHMAY